MIFQNSCKLNFQRVDLGCMHIDSIIYNHVHTVIIYRYILAGHPSVTGVIEDVTFSQTRYPPLGRRLADHMHIL